MLFNILFFILVTTTIVVTLAERESVLYSHVAGGGKPHDAHEDHKIVLGSEKLAQEFDDMSPEESKRRLRVLARKMDANSDGVVMLDELTNWIENSSRSLDNEENDERFAEMDANKDGYITWEEYIQEAFYGASEEGAIDVAKMDHEDRKLFEEDRLYFEKADEDHDGLLCRSEFSRFQNPELYESMHDTLVKLTLVEKDVNGDGKIDIKEYMGDMADQPKSEFYVTEKSRFEHDFDKNGDGFLDGEELKAWLVPDLRTAAEHEAEHLIKASDTDGDGRLTIDEIVTAHAQFVGSEATNYGEHMLNLSHDEL